MGKSLLIAVFVLLITIVCIEATHGNDDGGGVPVFSLPETVVFEKTLAAYHLFEGPPVDLIPASDFHEVTLNSILFTDYAHKQRLLKIPAGTKMTSLPDGTIAYPDGTILAKTFFYQNDERDARSGKQLIETRLEIKEEGKWNVATYLWNQAQTDAILALEGADLPVKWISAEGISQSTRYHVPTQNECIACHQRDAAITPIGPSLRNLNRMVERDGTNINQLAHLQAAGVLSDMDPNQVSAIVDYMDERASLAERGRAYLDLNCAHCHNPAGWKNSSQRSFDFRYDTPIEQTGILPKHEKILRTMLRKRMPLVGTSMLDEEGLDLIRAYFQSL